MDSAFPIRFLHSALFGAALLLGIAFNANAQDPKSNEPALVKRSIDLPAGFIPEAEYVKPERALSRFVRTDVSAFLESKGLEWLEGSSASYLPVAHELELVASAKAFDQIAAIVKAFKVEPEQDDSDRTPFVRKLESIVLPQIELHEATLKEAVEILRSKSKDLDPTHEGVAIKMTLEAENSNTPITIKLREIPIIEALKYVCSLSNVLFSVHVNEIVISEFGDQSASPRLRKTYALPQTALTSDGSLRGPDGKIYSDPTSLLVAFGVSFPDDTTCALVDSGKQLLVCQTRSSLRQIEVIVAAIYDAKGEALPQSELKSMNEALFWIRALAKGRLE